VNGDNNSGGSEPPGGGSDCAQAGRDCCGDREGAERVIAVAYADIEGVSGAILHVNTDNSVYRHDRLLQQGTGRKVFYPVCKGRNEVIRNPVR